MTSKVIPGLDRKVEPLVLFELPPDAYFLDKNGDEITTFDGLKNFDNFQRMDGRYFKQITRNEFCEVDSPSETLDSLMIEDSTQWFDAVLNTEVYRQGNKCFWVYHDDQYMLI